MQNHRSPQTRSNLAFIFCALFASDHAKGMWVTPSHAPVERLIDNAQGYIDAKPDDARGYYVLGRIHGLAYALKTQELRAKFSDAEKGKLLPNLIEHLQNEGGKGDAKPPTKEQLHDHLRKSLENQFKAAEMFPSAAVVHLGVASTMQHGAADASAIGLPPGAPKLENKLSKSQQKTFERYIGQLGSDNEKVADRALKFLMRVIDQAMPLIEPHFKSENEKVRAAVGHLLTAHWKELAIHHHLKAFELSVEKDTRTKLARIESDWDLIGLVSYEAAKEAIALAGARGVRPDERALIGRARAYVRKVKSKVTVMLITPIVLCIDRPRELSAMIDVDQRVAFDLLGNGIKRHWAWPQPHTAFLVWDPENTGRITSGRQMFGSVTWWMFWRDGYHALDALDDNRDSNLAGQELRGLSLWFDRNSNGISEPGEVQPVETHGITSLSTQATSLADDKRSPANQQGVTFKDGRQLPTVDWVAESGR